MVEFLPINEQSREQPQVSEINALTEAIGWGQRDPAAWERILNVSSYIAYARNEEGELVGFGRILDDGVMCMLYDIGVHPDFQGKGIGSKIMEELIGKIKDVGYVSIGLFVWEDNPGASRFYEKFGFENVTTGMELKRLMRPE